MQGIFGRNLVDVKVYCHRTVKVRQLPEAALCLITQRYLLRVSDPT